MARITTKEELRRIIAEPRPATRVKILDALDEQSIEFLKRCPLPWSARRLKTAPSKCRPRATSRGSSASKTQRRC